MKLYISGGTHLLTRARTRADNIEKKVGELDAIFLEGATDNPPLFIRLRNWVVCPFLLAPITVYLFLLRTARRVMTSDDDIAEILAENHDAPIYYVDKSHHEIIANQWPFWGITNWVVVTFPLFQLIFVEAPLIRLFTLMMIVLASAGLMSGFLAGTIEERNLAILQQIEKQSDGIERACMITGRAHGSGLSDLSKLFPQIETNVD